MICADCPWCIPSWDALDLPYGFFTGFRCHYHEQVPLPQVHLSDECFKGFSSPPH